MPDLPENAQVVVIGGGVVGASVLYHLTKAGWTDVVLLERRELTAGSTWHAAGGMHTINGDPNVAALQRYTVQLYEDLERESGVSCGLHLTGEVMLADSEDRMDWLRMAHARGRYLGMQTDLISVAEAAEKIPFIVEENFVGALWDPVGGHVDPSGVTHAYATAARMAGAQVHRNTWAHDVVQRPDGQWDVVTERGTVTCEHFVNCGGLWAREVGRMCGLELPILAMEHMYLLTEELPEIKPWLDATGGYGIGAIDFGGEIYTRAEAGGLLLGTYEKACVPWSVKETSWDFGSELLAPDLDRIAPSLAVGFEHFPIYAEAGIRQVINGPFTFASDGNPLIGPIRGQRGHWVACGVMAGLSQGGGVGLAMANWMTTGDPGFDVWGMDVARYGDWTTPSYTKAKVMENYSRRFSITFPNEELPAGRPLHASPIYGRLSDRNAVWGSSYGLETALWFQRPGEDPVEDVTFHRSNAFDMVAEEVHAVRTGVGLLETTGFAKHEFTGPGARALLDRVLANRIPPPGRMALAPMLDHGGRIIGDFTVACTADPFDGTETFLVLGSGVAEGYHQRWFLQQVAEATGEDPGTEGTAGSGEERVGYRPLGHEIAGLSLAGPAARDVLATVLGERADDATDKAFRFRDVRHMDLGMVPALVGRITFTGDLGYEMWVAASLQQRLFDLLAEAGAPHGLRPFGLRALDSMRFDKGFGAWATEYRPIYTPSEAGMDTFVALKAADGSARDFIGRDAVTAERASGPERRLCLFTLDDGGVPAGRDVGTDVLGDEPIWHGGEVVGWATSGGYAHWSQASCALGYVPAALADPATPVNGFELEVLGVRRAATRRDEPLFDPTGSRMRG
ncbi:MAG: FAD-dependent oxidoreductase [Actinomycetota bacterium]|nr:FAD-dependent oxidoreductase [Actinomycetota bacterium]MED6328648.1 FAD-dependent oxidoreductase [Actinomycetota bacterium]MEE2957568.1 FAD-dependent oxidoreductase [Actinomycetota bacterium]